MNTPKRHHVVPRLYLKKFSGPDGKIHIYDRKRNIYRNEGVDNCGVISHYYSVERDGEKDATVEIELSKMESDVAPLLEKLSSGTLLDSIELEAIHYFMAVQTSRVPAYRNAVENAHSAVVMRAMHMMMSGGPDRIARLLNKTGDDVPSETRLSPQELYDGYKKYGHLVKAIISPDVSLRQMIETATNAMQYMHHYNRVTLHKITDDSQFITSDTPIIAYNAQSGNWSPGVSRFGLEGTFLSMVLDPKTLATFGTYGPVLCVKPTTEERVFPHNCYMADLAYDFVVAKDEAMLRRVVERTGLAQKKPNEMFKV